MKRVRIRVGGQVQGVGFRPFVYRLATELEVSGLVGNTPAGVVIEAQGDNARVDDFARRIQSDAPPLARIVDFEIQDAPFLPEEAGFRIQTSTAGCAGHAVLISPDVAACPDCLRELFDPDNRRYLYPFINCTNCGPRFTITRSIPYDRSATSMACFPLCPDCAAEYTNPADRRFHAQPNACPVCGPQVWLATRLDRSWLAARLDKSWLAARLDKSWLTTPETADTSPEHAALRNADAVAKAAEILVAGKIVAVRGLGGFHLACDARNPEALAELRRRKHRPHKSLAIMARNLDAVRRVAVVDEAAASLLTSPACPIVILPRIPDALPDLIAPDITSLGVMLPSTPLHHVLLHAVAQHSPNTDALVMTSGNPRGEPLCLGNREALAALASAADCFLLHNRDILVRADDSVVQMVNGTPLLHRRARGYVPSPLPFPDAASPPVLGVGAHLKATLCCTRRQDAFVSQHIGDLENLPVTEFYAEACNHLLRLLEVEPQTVVCDLHPGYHSTHFARTLAEQRGIPLLQVQHHAAHLHAVLGEHRHTGPALGLMLDGTGYGPDKTIWGGELLFAQPGHETRRLGRLTPFALPGGEVAIREPWRLAVGLFPDAPLPAHLAFPQADAVRELAHSSACLRTSSCGRLFDAVSALLNLCPTITYEGQAAIRLEHAQDFSTPHSHTDLMLPLHEGELLELDVSALFGLLAERQPRTAPGVLARLFHVTLMDGLCRLARAAADSTGIRTIALGGGVFQNATLARELPARLRDAGLIPLLPSQLSPGDGAVSYGQVIWAAHAALSM